MKDLERDYDRGWPKPYGWWPSGGGGFGPFRPR